MRGEIAATREGKILAIRTDVLADHGAFNGVAAPAKYQPGSSGFHRQLRHRGRLLHDDGRLYEHGPRGVAYSCSFRITEAVYLVERLVDCLAYELRMTLSSCGSEICSSPTVPYTTRPGGVRLGQLRAHLREALRIADYDELRASRRKSVPWAS